MARLLARQLESRLGQTIVVDNRGGANGIIGIDIVSKAPADGYTLLSTASVFAINPAIYRKLPYDTEKDFVPIANFVNGPGYVFVAHPSTGAQTLKDLVSLAREKPLRYSTAGIGNGQHLVGELLNMNASISLQHVPYKGGGPAFNAVVGGEVHVHFAAAVTTLAHVKAGRLRALGFTGAARLPALPEVPTFVESGYAGFVYQTGWHAWFAPARTPAPIITRLNQEMVRYLGHAEVKEKFFNAALEVVGSTPEELTAKMKSEMARLGKVIKDVGIRVE